MTSSASRELDHGGAARGQRDCSGKAGSLSYFGFAIQFERHEHFARLGALVRAADGSHAETPNQRQTSARRLDADAHLGLIPRVALERPLPASDVVIEPQRRFGRLRGRCQREEKWTVLCHRRRRSPDADSRCDDPPHNAIHTRFHGAEYTTSL